MNWKFFIDLGKKLIFSQVQMNQKFILLERKTSFRHHVIKKLQFFQIAYFMFLKIIIFLILDKNLIEKLLLPSYFNDISNPFFINKSNIIDQILASWDQSIGKLVQILFNLVLLMNNKWTFSSTFLLVLYLLLILFIHYDRSVLVKAFFLIVKDTNFKNYFYNFEYFLLVSTTCHQIS